MAASPQYGDITPIIPSGIGNGTPLLITAVTAGTAQTYHTATASTSDMDQITLMANNTDTVDRDVTVLVGGVTEPDNIVCGPYTLTAKTGAQVLCDHIAINNSKTVKVYASVGSKITVFGPPVLRTTLT